MHLTDKNSAAYRRNMRGTRVLKPQNFVKTEHYTLPTRRSVDKGAIQRPSPSQAIVDRAEKRYKTAFLEVDSATGRTRVESAPEPPPSSHPPGSKRAVIDFNKPLPLLPPEEGPPIPHENHNPKSTLYMDSKPILSTDTQAFQEEQCYPSVHGVAKRDISAPYPAKVAQAEPAATTPPLSPTHSHSDTASSYTTASSRDEPYQASSAPAPIQGYIAATVRLNFSPASSTSLAHLSCEELRRMQKKVDEERMLEQEKSEQCRRDWARYRAHQVLIQERNQRIAREQAESKAPLRRLLSRARSTLRPFH